MLNFKKALVLLLTFCMLLTVCMSFSAMADEETVEESATEAVSETVAEKETFNVPIGQEKDGRYQTAFVYDKIGQLTPDQIARINSSLMDILSRANENAKGKDLPSLFVVVASYSKTAYIGEDFLREFHMSESDPSIILILSKSSSEWYYDMYTYGTAMDRISDNEVERILDADTVYPLLKNASHGDNLVDGTIGFFDASMQAYLGRYGASLITIIIVCFIISLIIGAIACGVVMGKYAMKMRPTNYPLEKYTTLELNEKSDNFKGSYVRTRRIQSSSGSSGGGGVGGGSGHRGGR